MPLTCHEVVYVRSYSVVAGFIVGRDSDVVNFPTCQTMQNTVGVCGVAGMAQTLVGNGFCSVGRGTLGIIPEQLADGEGVLDI